MISMTNILQRDGLTIELLARLSYKSELGINLKKNLHYFDKDAFVGELIKVNEWYDEFEELVYSCVKCTKVLISRQNKILRRR